MSNISPRHVNVRGVPRVNDRRVRGAQQDGESGVKDANRKRSYACVSAVGLIENSTRARILQGVNFGAGMSDQAGNEIDASSTNLPLLEREAIAEFVAEVGAVAAARTLMTFLAETERRLLVLRDLAPDQRDLAPDQREAIHVEAHTLKGSSGIFGLLRLSAAALRLERNSATMTAEAYRAMRSDLEAIHRLSRPVLVAYLETLRDAQA